MRRTGESLHCLEHGQVGLAGSVVLKAAGARDPHRRDALPDRRRVEEGLDQGRLPDARGTGDEDDLPFACLRPGEMGRQKMQLLVAAHERILAKARLSPEVGGGAA